MNIRDALRRQLFEVLIPTPPGAWPGDEEALFSRGLDSLRVMRLLVWIEEQLGVQLPDDEITPERLASVSALAGLVEEHARA
jgi:D-alanine--poly(phosphoribitol) ligase subunit 2